MCSGSRCPCGEYCTNKRFQRVSPVFTLVTVMIHYWCCCACRRSTLKWRYSRRRWRAGGWGLWWTCQSESIIDQQFAHHSNIHVLGNYLPATIVCLQIVLIECVQIKYINRSLIFNSSSCAWSLLLRYWWTFLSSPPGTGSWWNTVVRCVLWQSLKSARRSTRWRRGDITISCHSKQMTLVINLIKMLLCFRTIIPQ